jgi:hypothetical protein
MNLILGLSLRTPGHFLERVGFKVSIILKGVFFIPPLLSLSLSSLFFFFFFSFAQDGGTLTIVGERNNAFFQLSMKLSVPVLYQGRYFSGTAGGGFCTALVGIMATTLLQVEQIIISKLKIILHSDQYPGALRIFQVTRKSIVTDSL